MVLVRWQLCVSTPWPAWPWRRPAPPLWWTRADRDPRRRMPRALRLACGTPTGGSAGRSRGCPTARTSEPARRRSSSRLDSTPTWFCSAPQQRLPSLANCFKLAQVIKRLKAPASRSLSPSTRTAYTAGQRSYPAAPHLRARPLSTGCRQDRWQQLHDPGRDRPHADLQPTRGRGQLLC